MPYRLVINFSQSKNNVLFSYLFITSTKPSWSVIRANCLFWFFVKTIVLAKLADGFRSSGGRLSYEDHNYSVRWVLIPE